MEIPKSTLATNTYTLPRWLSWLHVALLLVTACFWGMFLHSATLHGYVYKRDFSSVYVGARAIAEGRAPQLYDLETQRQLMDSAILPYHRYNLLPFIYPAYVAVLLSPLGALSLDQAFLVWTGINFLAAAWLIAELTRSFSIPSQWGATLVAVLAWVPLQLTLGHGQVGLLCTLGMAKAMLALRNNQPWHAGGWLALGILKPQILILPLVALLLWRCWRTLATFLGIALLIAGISFMKAGLWIGAYLRFIADFNQRGAEVSLYPMAMQNWRGLVSSILRSDTSVASHSALGALTVATILIVLLVCRRLGSEPTQSHQVRALPIHWEPRFAVVVLAGILASPYLYAHDWVMALPALLILFQWAAARFFPRDSRRHRLPKTLLWLIGLSPFVCFAAQFDLSAAKSPIPVVPFYMGTLMVVAALVLQRSSEPEPATAST